MTVRAADAGDAGNRISVEVQDGRAAAMLRDSNGDTAVEVLAASPGAGGTAISVEVEDDGDGGVNLTVSGPEGAPRVYGELKSISAVKQALDDAPFEFDRPLERGPAGRASIALPPFERELLSGSLFFQFNENGGADDLPPEMTVEVELDDREYTPADLARVIHARLFDGGIGFAAAFPDGSIVIESAATGLFGSVRFPGAATPDSGPDRDLVDRLLAGGGELFAVGWPGVEHDNALQPLKIGWRSRPGPATAAAGWVFRDGDGREASVAVAAGETLAVLANRLDAALASASHPTGAVTPARIGIARLREDGAPTRIFRMPAGRYVTAVRVDAAKSHDYDAAAEMVVSGGVDPADTTRAFVSRTRYWVDFGPAAILRGVVRQGNFFGVDLELRERSRD